MYLSFESDDQQVVVHLPQCLHVPDLSASLLSTYHVTLQGYEIIHTAGRARAIKGNTWFLIAELCQRTKMYQVMSTHRDPHRAYRVTPAILHRRFAHQSKVNIDYKGDRLNVPSSCVACHLGKAIRSSFSPSDNVATYPLQGISSDVAGPSFIASLDGKRYFMIVVEHFSKKFHVDLLESKSQVKERLVDWITLQENQLGQRLQLLRTDNGGEFLPMKDVCRVKGIAHETTASYTPEQNGIAERAVRTVKEGARTLLIDSGLPDQFWGAAVKAFTYVRNLTHVVEGETRPVEEVFTGRKQSLDHLRVLGCVAYAHIPKEKRHKRTWKPKAIQGIMIGYGQDGSGKKAWVIYDPVTKAKILTPHATFMEDQRWASRSHVDRPHFMPEEEAAQPIVSQLPEPEDDVVEIPLPRRTAESGKNGNAEAPEYGREREGEQRVEPPVERGLQRRQPARQRHLPSRYSPSVYNMLARSLSSTEHQPDLNTVIFRAMAASFTYSAKDPIFDQAKLHEIESTVKHNVWALVPPEQATKKAIPVIWICNMKDLPNAEPFPTARLCARGDMQKEGSDYVEIFAPVVKLDSVRVIVRRG